MLKYSTQKLRLDTVKLNGYEWQKSKYDTVKLNDNE